MRPLHVVPLGLALVCLTTLAPSAAAARKTHDFTHRFEQVWSAAVRMVRVDLRFEVRDQDPSIGYLLFEYRDTANQTTPGSVELVRVQAEGREAVRVVVQVPQKPSYIEQMLIDRLGRKLLDEFGEPPAPPRRPARDDGAERQPRGDEDARDRDRRGPASRDRGRRDRDRGADRDRDRDRRDPNRGDRRRRRD